jgi:hypothetical protein
MKIYHVNDLLATELNIHQESDLIRLLKCFAVPNNPKEV